MFSHLIRLVRFASKCHMSMPHKCIIISSSVVASIGMVDLINNMACFGHISNPGPFLLPKAAVGGAIIGAILGYSSPVMLPVCLSVHVYHKLIS